jgi:type II secretory pathway pseudopilin PulG
MIELLVVVGIIGVLATIGLAVASKVTNTGRIRATEDTIKVLDGILAEYVNAKGGIPPKELADPDPTQKNRYLLFDGRLDGLTDYTQPANQSVAYFLAVASEVPAVDALIKGMDSKLVKSVTIGVGDPKIQTVAVLDGFGNPIRFVHPAFDGGYGQYWDATGSSLNSSRAGLDYQPTGLPTMTLRRSYRPYDPSGAKDGWIGDADEGICPGNSPYFYSAGPDGDPGTRDDNIYSIKPTFPAETAAFK